ncbi:type IV secretion system protein, partial [Rickettsia endosymbiont of Cardiosporidium cionae]|uniref:type IV secretion system protein n=1 Tax=Rickettsia endosymbiont of Cardiosporidium cionae TaxID=2777155 RepID=UPI0018961C42
MIIYIFANTTAYALEDFAENDSCIAGMTIIQRVINNIVSLGAFSSYSSAFDMTGAEKSRCSIPSNDIKFNFSFWGIDGPKIEEYTFKNGDINFWLLPPTIIKVTHQGDKICAQVLLITGFQSLGCKYRPDPSFYCSTNYDPIYGCRDPETRMKNNCFVGRSCAKNAEKNSKGLIPMTSTVVQCAKETLHRIFVDQSDCKGSKETNISSFSSFQDSMRNIIRVALTIYVAVLGIKILLGSDIPSRGEIFIFFMKFILVLYFSTGIYTGKGKDKYTDGITTILKPALEQTTTSLSRIVFNAGGAEGLCNYTKSNYKGGYGYLALFDAIDCRLLHYLGISVNHITGAVSSIKVFAMILPALLSFQLIFMIMCIIFVIYLLSITIFFTYLYIIALIAQHILIYMAPIFVAFALFNFSKGYFEAWL